jgi:hypothetical protein
MNPEREVDRNNAAPAVTRNPFGVMDVPDPDDADVAQFAAGATLDGSAADDNAAAWSPVDSIGERHTILGNWSSRWNGGADPMIAGDTAKKWKQGRAEARMVADRVYLYFEWNLGARKGLIDARREGPNRLVGKYINLTNPDITRPWVGLIVDDRRIDGRWTQGRLDFRR